MAISEFFPPQNLATLAHFFFLKNLLYESHWVFCGHHMAKYISWVISPTWVDHSCRVIDHAVGACILTWKFFTGRMINNTTPCYIQRVITSMGGRYLIFVVSTDCIWKKNQNQRTVSSKSLKSFRIKEPHVLGVWKNQIQRIVSFGYFRSFKEPPGFMKEPANPAVWGGYLVLVIFFWKPLLIYNNRVFDTMIIYIKIKYLIFFGYSWS